MKMESAVPFIAMVIQQLAQVGLMVASEIVTSADLTTFTFLFYSSFFSTLILIPISFFFHRSALPPLWPTFFHGFFLLGIIGMETFEYKSLSTVAKTIGTLVSIIGALVATLYEGPDVSNSLLTSLPHFLNQPSAWVIGGLVAMIGALISSVFIISQAVFGSVFQVCISSWVVKRRGPLFVVMFHPLGIVFAMAANLFMGEAIHVGSLLGSAIIVAGFYSVIWGKAKEWKKEEKTLGSNNNKKKMPLLQDKVNDPEVNI